MRYIVYSEFRHCRIQVFFMEGDGFDVIPPSTHYNFSYGQLNNGEPKPTLNNIMINPREGGELGFFQFWEDSGFNIRLLVCKY